MPPKKRKAPTKDPQINAAAKRVRKTSYQAKHNTPDNASEVPDALEDPNTVHPQNPSRFVITPNLKSPIPCHIYNGPKSPSLSSSTPSLIFTHGASGTLTTPSLSNFCIGFSTTKSILSFQGSMNLAARVKAFHAILSYYQTSTSPSANPGASTALGGRSMGARAAVMTALDLLSPPEAPLKKQPKSQTKQPSTFNLILSSYPLKGPKNDLRDQILLDLPSSAQVLFIIGAKDSMCPLDTLASVRSKMSAKSSLAVVRGADHGMKVSPKKAETAVGEMTGRLAAEWLGEGPVGKECEVWWDTEAEKVEKSEWG